MYGEVSVDPLCWRATDSNASAKEVKEQAKNVCRNFRPK